ncbi:hypothetical protein [Poseidonocella sp. HB161398]|uniref:hypothetical protein n=1 Tax=Poseidonocella sp. HB161398 TaxID=2320855 RepID=UPI00110827ED|nr:hypothetical protein [Poseidonocella sp. HB161398]
MRGMMPAPCCTACGDVFGQQADAERAAAGIRINGGGNRHDPLIVMLTGNHMADSRARDGHVVTRSPGGPGRGRARIQNAGSHSDASVFPMLCRGQGAGDRTPAVSPVP